MPVPPEVRGVDGHHHVVPRSRGNLAIAVRAGVGLRCLVRLEESHVELTEALGVVHRLLSRSGPTVGGEPPPAARSPRTHSPSVVVGGAGWGPYPWATVSSRLLLAPPGRPPLRRVVAGLLILEADPNQIVDLSDGFSYTVVSRKDTPMSDGLRVPGAHDGMAAFDGKSGRIVLVCNHELYTAETSWGPFGDGYVGLPESFKARLYDRGDDETPEQGGTTTTIYNPVTQETERQFLSLGGTEYNCAGAKTPWGSWLSCEESFAGPGLFRSGGVEYMRGLGHGYVFEVPSLATELVKAVPLKGLGRFEHEAAAVHESTGIVYLTEDQWDSLFYRFIPDQPGQLQKGGRLQALAIIGQPSKKTHNWDARDVGVNERLITHWIDLEDVDSDTDDLRKRGASCCVIGIG